MYSRPKTIRSSTFRGLELRQVSELKLLTQHRPISQYGDLLSRLDVKYFAVTRERRPAWNSSASMRMQKRRNDHSRFMDALAEEGLVVLGGPLGKGEKQFLLIFNVDSAEAVETRLAADPWSQMELLQVAKIEPWEILLEKPSNHWAEIEDTTRKIRKKTNIGKVQGQQ